MDTDRAIEIVQNLADGVDPYSGERFASDSPYQQADAVRVLHRGRDGAHLHGLLPKSFKPQIRIWATATSGRTPNSMPMAFKLA